VWKYNGLWERSKKFLIINTFHSISEFRSGNHYEEQFKF
jgi:hypothetical protein